jgi:hypothetical protein
MTLPSNFIQMKDLKQMQRSARNGRVKGSSMSRILFGKPMH